MEKLISVPVMVLTALNVGLAGWVLMKAQAPENKPLPTVVVTRADVVPRYKLGDILEYREPRGDGRIQYGKVSRIDICTSKGVHQKNDDVEIVYHFRDPTAAPWCVGLHEGTWIIKRIGGSDET